MMSLLSNWVMPISIYNPFSYMFFFQNLFCSPHCSKLLIFFSCGDSFHTNTKKMSFIFLLNFIFSLSSLISNAVLRNLWKNTIMLLSLVNTKLRQFRDFALTLNYNYHYYCSFVLNLSFLFFWKIYIYNKVYFWYFSMWQRGETVK